MHTIEIDDEVFAHLQGHAVAYVETPNHTIRRLLGLKSTERATPTVSKARSMSGHSERIGRKSPKTSLPELISAGLLQEGQSLYLVDYRGKRVPNCEAKIAGQKLIWSGGRHSMSELAKILLKKQGFQSDSVRGPAHWSTADGITALVLWGRYLNGRQIKQTT